MDITIVNDSQPVHALYELNMSNNRASDKGAVEETSKESTSIHLMKRREKIKFLALEC